MKESILEGRTAEWKGQSSSSRGIKISTASTRLFDLGLSSGIYIHSFLVLKYLS